MEFSYIVLDLTRNMRYIEKGEFDSYRDFITWLDGMSKLHSGVLRFEELNEVSHCN